MLRYLKSTTNFYLRAWPFFRSRDPVALRISMIYILVSMAWLLFSDSLAQESWRIGLDETTVQSVKGFFFIAVTAAGFYWMMTMARDRELSLATRLRDAIDASRDGLWRWDFTKDDVTVTPGGDAELGWQAARTITNMDGWKAATHPDDWAVLPTLLNDLKETGRSDFTVEMRLLTSDGGWHWYQVKGKVLRRLSDGAVDVLEGTYHSIEALKQSQTALLRKNRALRILLIAYDAIIKSHTSAEAMSAIVRNIAADFNCAFVWIGEVTDQNPPDIKFLTSAGSAAHVPQELLSNRKNSDDTRRFPALTCMQSGEPCIWGDVENVGLDPAQVETNKSLGIRSGLAIPIFTREGRRFVLSIAGREPEQFSDDDSETYRTVGKVLELVLHSADIRFQFIQSETVRQELSERLQQAGSGAISALIAVIEKRDPYTAGHQQRVSDLAVAIGKDLDLGETQLEGLRIGAQLHDIGKIGVPTEILSKPGRLDPEEIALIRRHAQIGYDIVKNIDFGWPIEKIVHQHHERVDGTGYPQGLVGDEISLEARIVAVADVIESMGTNRPYRASLGFQALRDELIAGRGARYDERVVDAAIRILDMDAAAFGLTPWPVKRVPLGASRTA